MLIDETTDTATHHYRLTQTHHLDGHTIRVRVHRDFYPHQSWAYAEVLTPALNWTELATAPASDWHPATPTPTPTARTATDGLDCLRPIADHLTQRAQRLLSTITHPTTPATACATPAAPAPSPTPAAPAPNPTPLPTSIATTPPQHQPPSTQAADHPYPWQPPS